MKKNKQLKYTDLARLLGLTKQGFFHHLKQLEKGKNTLSAKQMKLIADYLERDISIFF